MVIKAIITITLIKALVLTQIKMFKKNQSIKQTNLTVNINNILIVLERNQKDYKINPRDAPRPIYLEEVFRDKSILMEFNTEAENQLPATTLSYLVNETYNSSCRFIRPSINRIPVDQSVLNSMAIPFSIHVQPFAELAEGEREVPKIQGK